MKTSDSIKSIAPALLQAQKSITFAGKNARNPHFKNTYADLSAVIDALKPALNNVGIVFMQTPSPSDAGTLALTTRLIHAESGEFMEDTGICPLPKSDPQGYGSAMTYMRRYSLASICGLYQDDDDGEGARPAPINQQALEKAITDIYACSDLSKLKVLWEQAIVFCGADYTSKKRVNEVVRKRKEELDSVEA
jgi:hypothetical protein